MRPHQHLFVKFRVYKAIPSPNPNDANPIGHTRQDISAVSNAPYNY